MIRKSQKTIIVVGGTGFLGSKICEAGAKAGHKMISLSRTGNPHFPVDSQLVGLVDWIKFDALKDFDGEQNKAIEELFSKADVVVHSVGILYEPQTFAYKLFLKSSSEPQLNNTGYDVTYETMNRDSALKLASYSKRFSKIKSFVYISASQEMAQSYPAKYISTKIEAEKGIFALNRFRSMVFRPGLMFSGERPITKVLTKIQSFLKCMPFRPSWANVDPLPVADVGRAIITAIDQDKPSPSKEVFEVDQIKALFEKK